MTKTSAAERRCRQSKRKAEGISPSTAAAAAAGFDRSQEEMEEEEEFFEGGGEPRALERTVTSVSPIKKRIAVKRKEENAEEDGDCCFVGDPVPQEEAKRRWPERYKRANGAKAASITDKENNDIVKARRHFLQARVDDCIYNLYDSAYVQADGEPNYIGRILEFFETCDHQLYFTAQWFFRAQDTVIKEHAISCDAESHYHVHDAKRVFLSEDKDDNALSCIVSKIQIVRVAPNIDLCAKEKSIPICDLYYDMTYSVQYATFANLPSECEKLSIPDSSHSTGLSHMTDLDCETSPSCQRSQLSLLDLYSGCGGMSTGLCLGANVSGVNLQTRWAVDLNPHACESLRFNHPETEVRNEEAQDFLDVLREWEKLCLNFGLGNESTLSETESLNTEEEDDQLPGGVVSEEFEVERIVDICYGKTSNLQKPGLKFKVRWKGYGPNDDTWEPADGLSKCQERIEEFVRHGYRKKILPLPGTIDVICGGPPCQGISGFNLYRNSKAPLDDVKNKQMVVFMEIIDFLKPRFVLMENVVDILKFAEGFLGRYALSRLVAMNYQSRLGIVVAGCYGLPQFRMRVFLWGALPSEKLPQFPLPTHDVVVRGGCPVEFECCSVAYKQNQHRELKKALLLSDAISDLPPVANNELRDEMDYVGAPVTDFQRFIRRSREGESSSQKRNLFDHRPFKLKEDDYIRVCRIPKRKGANFRDLPGVIVGPDKKAMLDPQVEREYLASGKPLVPNYAIAFTKGKSLQPFGRLWWDEIVPTVVTRPEPHNRTILHPEQDRVLTIRENARLQGFPDYYKLFGPIRERYIQVGNAVAMPVSRALGYALGQAMQGKCSNEKPLFSLPPDFPTT